MSIYWKFWKLGWNLSLKKHPLLETSYHPVYLSHGNRETWLSTKGFHKCSHNHCIACNYMESIHKFTSTCNDKCFPGTSFIIYNSKNVVYLITCTTCRVQYVDCTTNSLKIWIRRHLSDARNSVMFNVSNESHHFIQVHNRDVSSFNFSGIERVKCPVRGGNLKKLLLKLQAKWIGKLNSRVPQGLKLCCDIMYKRPYKATLRPMT